MMVEDLAGNAAEWNEFVLGDAGSSFCHHEGWRTVMAEGLGHEAIYRVARSDTGAVAGVLPMVRVKSRLFGHYLVSMPFLSYGGPLGSESARRTLTADAVRIADETGADLLELRTRGARPLEPLNEIERKVAVTLELPDAADLLWKEGLKAKVRSQVRRPMKEGMTTRFGTGELEGFYSVFARHMRDLGTPVLPRGFFHSVAANMEDHVVFGCVYLEDEPVAGGCGFVWRDEFEMTWASSLREHQRKAPNMLLYWSFMERMIERGIGVFNFGRCTPGAGTHRFKLQWGGEDERLIWGQHSSKGLQATPNPDQGKYQLATRVWQKLPISVSNMLGPFLARRIP